MGGFADNPISITATGQEYSGSGSIQTPGRKQYRRVIFSRPEHALMRRVLSDGNCPGCGRIRAVFKLQKIKVNQVLKCTVKIKVSTLNQAWKFH
jgi:hypothetical protein